MAADSVVPSLRDVEETLDRLHTTNAEERATHVTRLEAWARSGLPNGAATLILDRAGRRFPSTGGYPETPVEQLLRLLWDSAAEIITSDVEALYPRLDEDEYRACAIRLLAGVKSRDASASLARILTHCRNGRLPHVLWPFLLPLEHDPRDADLLVSPLLDVLVDTDGDSVTAVLAAYAEAGLLDPAAAHACAETAAVSARRMIDIVSGMLAKGGVERRWDDECLSVKGKMTGWLELLARLNHPVSREVFEYAVESPDPAVALPGAIGMLRAGAAVSPAIIESIAMAPDCRAPLLRELEEIDCKELFPQRFMNQASLAEAVMVEWLAFPTELERAPDEIRLLDVKALDTHEGPADLYVYAFRTHAPHWLSPKDWVVGVAGPFLQSEQPTLEGFGYTFSRLESLADISVDDHVAEVLESLQQMQ